MSTHPRIVHALGSSLAPILADLPRIAESRANVLVTGESGAGKEIIVREIHWLSPASEGRFVPVNCGAIPDTLLESEFFGHARGAFTGADRARAGRLEAADGGTLFLDEIGEMPLAMQVKLLRVLQDKRFEPLGSTQARSVDFRLVAATNRSLQEAVSEGRFRQDLFFRLDVARIHIPSLRDRPMDVAPLARHFLRLHAERTGSHVEGISNGALLALAAYPWPGNVRELENAVQGILVLKRSGRIDEADVARRLRGRQPESAEPAHRGGGAATMEAAGGTLPEEGIDLNAHLGQLERHFIQEALRRADGNKARAAALLGLKRTTLVEKLKRHRAESDVA